MGEVSLQKGFPYSRGIFLFEYFYSGKKTQVKIKLRLAGGEKTGQDYLVLGYIPASLEIKTLAIEHVPPPKKSLGSVPYIG